VVAMRDRLPADQVSDARADSIGEMAATSPNMTLRVRDRVALVVEAFAPLAATVAAAERTQATLVLDGAGALPARMLHRRAAAIETAIGGRRYRAEGKLAMVAGRRGKAREDAIAFHFRDAHGGRDGRRLRPREDRTPAVLPVTLVPIHAQLPPARGLTLNVSSGGALLRGPAGLEDGHELLLHLHLPTEELPIPAKAEIVRKTEDGLLGVRLDKMRPADRELVLRWVAAQSIK
jgi:PilZ domain